MMVGLCWILGCYGLAIVLVHALGRLNWLRSGNAAPAQVVLLTRNNQTQIEWYLRYISLVSWWKGRPVRVMLTDSGSTDETLAIAEKLSCKLPIRVDTRDDASRPSVKDTGERAIVVSLLDRTELVEIPLF